MHPKGAEGKEQSDLGLRCLPRSDFRKLDGMPILWLLGKDSEDTTVTVLPVYHKITKISDTWKFAVITLKVEQDGFTLE